MNPTYPCLGVPPNGFCPSTPTYPGRECTSGCSWWGSQYQGTAWPVGWGNADNWAAEARKAGFQVSAVPRINSIMCIPPNHNGAGPMGHVAFVTGNPVNGLVSVIEMNFLIEYGYDYRNAPVGGCEYIYLTPKPDPPAPPTKGVPQMFIWYQENGTISLCNGEKRIGFGDGEDVAQFSAFPSIHESNVTPAFAAKINALPYI